MPAHDCTGRVLNPGRGMRGTRAESAPLRCVGGEGWAGAGPRGAERVYRRTAENRADRFPRPGNEGRATLLMATACR